MSPFFYRAGMLLFLGVFPWFMPTLVWAQKQSFETPFFVVSYPQAFLPGWYANELRSTGARVFRLATSGLNGSGALAVQPLTTFSGKIWVQLSTKGMDHPWVVFWAKSLRNGTGTRPALVHASWSNSLEGPFVERNALGPITQFPNANQEFRKVELKVPEAFEDQEEVFLLLEIGVGPGTGSAARWVMDEFSVENRMVDTLSPRVYSVKGYGPKEIMITFSEPLDPIFAKLSLAYGIEGRIPSEIKMPSDSVVVIRSDQDLQEDQEYSLFLQSLPDLSGNFLQDTLLKFTYTDPTRFGPKSLVINEIMPSPRQDQDLPFVEYVEVMNPLKKELRIVGISLSTSTKSTPLQEFWIQPGAYVLLCPANQAKLLEEFGTVIPLMNWPGLSNSGELLRLHTASGKDIDYLSYRSASWGGGTFANGGYSLEVPNPFFRCEASDYLLPSNDPKRGTPGVQNSHFYPDQDFGKLQLDSAFFRNSTQVELVFNQPVASPGALASYAFSPELKIDSLWIFSSGRKVGISLASPATPSKVYILSLPKMETCLGKSSEDGFRAQVILPELAEAGELVINELLMDPKPGDPKFVEIHNTTDSSYLSLEGWALARQEEVALPAQQVRVFETKGLMIPPKGFLAISEDPARLRLSYSKSADGAFLSLSSMPSYPISGATLLLLSPEGKVMESIPYSPSWHHPLLQQTKGVSLERVSSKSPGNYASNWQSASSTEEYATPGRKNSVAFEGEREDNRLVIEPEVFDPEGSQGPRFTTIRYSLDQNGWVGSFRIYSAIGHLVYVLGENLLLGTEGLFSWSGTDELGQRLSPGYYVVVAEIFELKGRSSLIKKTVVLGTPLQ